MIVYSTVGFSEPLLHIVEVLSRDLTDPTSYSQRIRGPRLNPLIKAYFEVLGHIDR